MAGKTVAGREDEAAFLEAYDAGKYERPSVAVDVSLLAVRGGRLVTWLVRRPEHPHRGRYALPGGFVRMGESLDAAAQRVLAEKSGLARLYLEQLYTFGAVQRDPRTRVISVAHYALIDLERLLPLAEARRDEVFVAELHVPWQGEEGGPVEAHLAGTAVRLAFDHAEQLGMAVKRLRGKLAYAPVGFQLLPREFTLRDLQRVHEAVLARSLNKDSFRRKMLASEQLEPTGELEGAVGHRPAERYRFVSPSAL
ncbi:MAG: hypothetical protein RL385_3415 [Pseudomonadota bacterium]